METTDYLDFDDILSHHKETLELGADFDLVEIISNVVTTDVEEVYDLVVDGNRNYSVDVLGVVHNGGLRQGAGTVALPIWHNDISDFLDMQTENGDIRLKSYDVFPQVCVPDLFMRRDKEMGDWTTFCPFEVKNVLGIEMYGLYGDAFESAYLKIEEAAHAGKLKITKTVKARDLFKLLMRPMFETGLPYVAFIDEINRQNPNKHEGYIPCVNLCTESFSNVVPDELTHVCNLASINLGNIRDMEHLAHVAKLATKALDYGISLTNNPLPSTLAHNTRYRTIGIGMMGLHDFLAKNFTSFNDLDLIRDIAECIEYNAAVQSVELQKLYGPFDAFVGSTWYTGERTREFAKHSKDPSKWHQLQLEIDKHGIRNSQLTSPAPTTSTSIYQDASATFLPAYSAFFSEDNSTGSVKVASKYLALNPLGYGKTQTKFQPNEIVAIAAEIQKFTDTGLSMELVFDQNRIGFKAKDLYDTIHYAHQCKLKSIYYIRSLKNNASISTESACVACSG